MRRLVLLDAAVDDLTSILDYIARESGSPETARHFVDRIVRQCTRLASLPGMLGRARPELRADIRSFAFRGYVIFFRYRDDRLEVVSVLEGHRDVDAHFAEKDDTGRG